ncbi:hypothetical protein BXT84_04755 [Sulfobacillus thermotolerans]|uniref:N-acetyltransferase domain-containing protein n=1 Tax=Sulfobacillus thermotolerans TaxID=338644 RepID=A0ABN5H1I5_9FIRM|nr:hypothetical protein BXT84_04755 [Sulfobacillus thermotolerans]
MEGLARIILRDGRVAELREARDTPEDRRMLHELFRHASADDLYFRFFHMVKEVSDRDIDQMIRIDGQGKSLICVSQDQILGIGHYIMTDGASAEVAFFVDDRVQGRGLGTLLLEHLAQIAWRRGLKQFEAYVLSDNRRMLRVFQDSGYEIHEQHESGVIHLVLPLQQTERTRALQETREKLATAASLRPFFEPAVVAIVGASRDSHRLGHLLLRHVLEGSYNGVVYPVNSSAKAVLGVRAYPSVQAVPDAVDLVVIVVARDQVQSVVQDCIIAGVKAVLITSAGFSDLDANGAALEQDITADLRRHGIRLVGPNSLGLLNAHPEHPLNASFAPALPPAGSVAIASQSGALGIAILDYAARMGVGVSSFASTGNKADVSSNDLLQYWEDDPATAMILLYLESFGNPRKFSRIARRLTQRKPILAVKSARTVHTSVPTESGLQPVDNEVAVQALFQQSGIIRADTLQELFDIAALLGTMPLPDGNRVVVITNAAGAAVITVDALGAVGLTLAEPPVDLGVDALGQRYYEEVARALRQSDVDAIIVLFIPVGISEAQGVSDAIRQAVEEQGLSKPVLANFLMMGHGPIDYIESPTFRIPVYPFPELAVRALGQVARYAEYRRQPMGRLPDLEHIHVDEARTLVQQWQSPDEAVWTGPVRASQVLDMVGLRSQLALTEEDQGFCRLRIRCHMDPLFGPILTATPVDQENISRSRLIPLTDRDAEVFAQAWLRGQKGAPFCKKVLSELFLRVSRLIDEVPEITELEIDEAWVCHADTKIVSANVLLERRTL